MLSDKETDDVLETVESLIQGPGRRQQKSRNMGVFSYLVHLYQHCLKLDPYDVEANFNIASLFLQRNDIDTALKHYKLSIKKDSESFPKELRELFGH